MSSQEPLSPFQSAHLEAIARVLGDTYDGLSGTDIGDLLTRSRIPDVDPVNTKWIRLYNAFAQEQALRGRSNHVVGFINKTLNPARWVRRSEQFESLRSDLNVALAFVGLCVNEEGRVRFAPVATTIRDAEARANRLRGLLRDAIARSTKTSSGSVKQSSCRRTTSMLSSRP